MEDQVSDANTLRNLARIGYVYMALNLLVL
jgi:hypothetical protein